MFRLIGQGIPVIKRRHEPEKSGAKDHNRWILSGDVRFKYRKGWTCVFLLRKIDLSLCAC
jgi:hypothetical protein